MRRLFATGISLVFVLIFNPSAFCQFSEPSTGSMDAVEDAKSAIDETRTQLAKLDGELEFPMSDPERKGSQSEVSKAKSKLLAEHPVRPPVEIQSIARDALMLANQAIDAARSGDRQGAIKLFTQSRIKLQEARTLLVNLETAGDQTRLHASATKADMLKNRSQPAGNSQMIVAGSSRSGSGDTVTINPSGVTVKEAGPGGDTVRISPGGVRISGSGSPQGTVSINPGGVVATRPGGTTKHLAVTPGGGSDRVMIGGSEGVVIGGSGTPRARSGSDGVNIGPGGISIGGQEGVQIRSGPQPGSTGISIGGPGGLTIGGGGLSDFIGAEIAGALGTSGVNAQGDGQTVYITGQRQDANFDAQGRSVVVSGHRCNVVISGYCPRLVVSGHRNIVSVQSVGSIISSGHHCTVYWQSGPNGRKPNIINSGNKCQVLRRVR